jgi:hypothetical protein
MPRVGEDQLREEYRRLVERELIVKMFEYYFLQ